MCIIYIPPILVHNFATLKSNWRNFIQGALIFGTMFTATFYSIIYFTKKNCSQAVVLFKFPANGKSSVTQGETWLSKYEKNCAVGSVLLLSLLFYFLLCT